MSTGKFSGDVVAALGKRAALRCSNPDCGVLTSGPSAEPSAAINIGEAAHIYGRTAEAARFNEDLTLSERSDITNGIWLCRNCHKMVDADEGRFPAELLFAWRQSHEREVLKNIGRKGDLLRQIVTDEKLRDFDDESYSVRQIALDKPDFWEYKLTAAILKAKLAPIHRQLMDLEGGLYVKKSVYIAPGDILDWVRMKFNEVGKIAGALDGIINKELPESWGPPGHPGDEVQILRVCKLLAMAAQNLLEWEEEIRFASFPLEFMPLQDLLEGVAGNPIKEVMKIPSSLSAVFDQEDPRGIHELNLTFNMPEGFSENYLSVLRECFESYKRNHG
ncbi:MAG: HNH endonuclease [Ferrovibrio sp.]